MIFCLSSWSAKRMPEYFQPNKVPVGTLERDLSDEVLAVLQAEATAQGEEHVYSWFRYYYLSEGIGLAPFDVAIADFASKRLVGRRFVEIGAGMAQLSALLALSGFSAVAVEAHAEIFPTTAAVHERVCRRFPGAADRFSIVKARFPVEPSTPMDRNTVVTSINVSQTVTPREFDDILDALMPAHGVIINLAGFFVPRRDPATQAELVERFTIRGFAAPEEVYAWTEPQYRFQPGRIVYFQNTTGA
jgi:hypothetical protein